MNRRDFLTGMFARSGKKSAPAPGCDKAGCTDDGCDWRQMLPPEFSPAMLRAQVQQLGLDPGTMNEEEIALAVIEAMNAQRPGGAGA